MFPYIRAYNLPSSSNAPVWMSAMRVNIVFHTVTFITTKSIFVAELLLPRVSLHSSNSLRFYKFGVYPQFRLSHILRKGFSLFSRF